MKNPKFTFPRYTDYKDSGVEWLGNIPRHWKSEKGKWLFLKMDRPVRHEDDVVTAFRDGQVTLRITVEPKASPTPSRNTDTKESAKEIW